MRQLGSVATKKVGRETLVRVFDPEQLPRANVKIGLAVYFYRRKIGIAHAVLESEYYMEYGWQELRGPVV
jgi:hypothetical protein